MFLTRTLATDTDCEREIHTACVHIRLDSRHSAPCTDGGYTCTYTDVPNGKYVGRNVTSKNRLKQARNGRQDDYDPTNPYGGRTTTETVRREAHMLARIVVEIRSTDLAVEEEPQSCLP